MSTQTAKSKRLYKRAAEPAAAAPPPPSKWRLFGFGASPQRQATLTLEEAFLAILMGAARADGSVSSEEVQEISALAGRTRLLSGVASARISEIQRKVEAKFEAEEINSVLVAACQTIMTIKDAKPEDTKSRAESVLALAIDIVFADREVTDSEMDYVEQLGKLLNISEQRASEIAAVIEIKNYF